MNLSFASLLLLGIVAGPYGLGLVSEPLLNVLDPGIAVAVATIGVFAGLSVESRSHFRRLTGVILILGGGVLIAAFRADSAIGAVALVAALAAISGAVAIALWLLTGQTSFDEEQHALVIGALLLLGGVATYLSLSAAVAGFFAGITWSRSAALAKARIVRALDYFEHPFIVVAFLAAGATAAISSAVVMLALALGASSLAGEWLLERFAPRSVDEVAAAGPFGLVAVALALDLSRSDSRPEWAATLLGAVVLAGIAGGLVSSVRTRVAA
jgi:hypothetical protein